MMSSSGKVFNVILNFLWLKKDFLMAKFYSLQQKLQSGFKPRASTSVVCRRFSPHQVHRYILKTLFHILTCESRSNTGVLPPEHTCVRTIKAAEVWRRRRA